MLNIILFGPPGAGKGTQSQFLREKYQLTYISTGEILREEIAAETELGLQVKGIISQGGLVSDEIVAAIIEKKLSENISTPESAMPYFFIISSRISACFTVRG